MQKMQLILINSSTIGDVVKQTVNARELHEFLEVKTAFKDWVARRIEEYGFTDGKDFCSFLSESGGGRPTKEYAITLDMAKELSMVERNERGKQARQYFIECEKQSKILTPAIQNPQTRALIQLLIEQDAIKNRVSLLEAKSITRDESYFTVAGFCNIKGIKLDRAGMAMVGKMATTFSRENGIKVGSVYDSRYGKVNEYHTSALQYAVEA